MKFRSIPVKIIGLRNRTHWCNYTFNIYFFSHLAKISKGIQPYIKVIINPVEANHFPAHFQISIEKAIAHYPVAKNSAHRLSSTQAFRKGARQNRCNDLRLIIKWCVTGNSSLVSQAINEG